MPDLRSQTQPKEKPNTPIVQEVIKDLLKSGSLIYLVENAVDKKIKSMAGTIEKQEAMIMDLQTENNQIKKEINNLNQSTSRHNDQLSGIDLKLNAEEQYSRRNCLRLFGCPEENKENTDTIVLEVVRETLQIELSIEDIERSHRVGQKKETSQRGARPRGIIVKLKSYRKREEIIKNRRKLKGTKIVIVEDLTAKNQALLNEARKHSKVETAWSKDGRIIALLKGNKNSTKLIRSTDDLKSL